MTLSSVTQQPLFMILAEKTVSEEDLQHAAYCDLLNFFNLLLHLQNLIFINFVAFLEVV